MELAAVRYTVAFPAPQTHYAEIEAVFPTSGVGVLDLFLPVWTPGSYMVREYSRHVENVRAVARGFSLPCYKIAKNRWRVETGGVPEIVLTYRVYGREMSVRTNWVEDSFALLNGACTFITLASLARNSASPCVHTVQLVLPPEWKISATGLEETAPGSHGYLAPDYDTLIDSPILAGNPEIVRFEVDGIPHALVNQSDGPREIWDGARAGTELERVVRHYRTMWGPLPYTRYVFLNLLTEAGGGLEHRNSVCMMSSRWSGRNRRAWLQWLSLASHEYFHVWNVKRLRPLELGPFDLESENYTHSLWVAEGITDYYAPLALRRSGISTRDEYLNGPDNAGGLSETIARLQNTPGRLVQSLAEASFDAWIKLYRPNENSVNTTISYYNKGAVVAWLLDAAIRRASGSVRSLDDVMRLAFTRYAGASGFSARQFEELASEVAGVSLRDFFHRNVESTEELDYADALDWFGLRFRTPEAGPGKAWLGIEIKTDQGRLVISKIRRGTPAFAACLNVDDEILALDEYRVRADAWKERLENYRPGDRVSVLVARRDKLIRLTVELGEEPLQQWHLEAMPEAKSDQKQHLENWLGT